MTLATVEMQREKMATKKENTEILSRVMHDKDYTLVELFKEGDKYYIKKTVKPPKIFGYNLNFLAEYLCSREIEALKRVKGLKNVQQFVRRESSTSFISEYIKGKTVYDAGQVHRGYFDKLERVIESVYSRGVAPVDVSHSKNMLVDYEGNPFIIDLAFSLIYEPNKREQVTTKFLLDNIRQLNKIKICKKKRKYQPSEMKSEEISLTKKTIPILIPWEAYRRIRRFIRYNLLNLPRKR